MILVGRVTHPKVSSPPKCGSCLWRAKLTEFSISAWTCVGALAILDRLDEVDTETLSWWLSERQLPNGGLNGRPEKLEDVSTISASAAVEPSSYTGISLQSILFLLDVSRNMMLRCTVSALRSVTHVIPVRCATPSGFSRRYRS
jgi:hypothetical protein